MFSLSKYRSIINRRVRLAASKSDSIGGDEAGTLRGNEDLYAPSGQEEKEALTLLTQKSVETARFYAHG